ncbi:1-acyl-sn-glycerol-3-phosphate acyltransferase [Kaistia dalseonensis]|uniref:1-acyl-sn-glycerol-3-phosphate acyltransferase n=1 Tax=Kaistia dalseonensis TaxID=410840 RepID=A0ABU0H599_9HYPH|nr:1-acyl-sn-glycerol-3-phosphate acyltransferase [Kaistia dalseonensis]MCX5494902.1 1-acyl-sn-glycerol-3-phosphate acyltransferase [Kaistia dalseonensis]MDQ0437483.1 1-acyl-sn-glycerol-3-phosphate acyltransferase [Kaistia dalseonensis]
MGRIRLALILAGLAITTLILLPFQLLAIRFSPHYAARIPLLWQRVARRLAGLTVHVEGMPTPDRPLLIVANHVSWLDIVTLGSVLPVSFIAKNEVSEWPVIKWLARLQRTVFIDRNRRTATAASNTVIADRLSDGDAIVLFAEGTTGDGISVLPFRSALLGSARGAAGDNGQITVQPVAIVYTALQGLPIGRLRMADVAWHGDMDLVPHLVGLLGVGSIDAVVAFGAPIAFGADADRKVVTAQAEAEVRRMVRAIRVRRGKSAAVAGPSRGGAILTASESG